MKLVTLQFPNTKDLWSFKLETETDIFEVNLRDRTITCKCSNTHIKLAIEKYHAKLVNKDLNEVSS